MGNKYLDRITELEWIVKERDKIISNMRDTIRFSTLLISRSNELISTQIDELNNIKYK